MRALLFLRQQRTSPTFFGRNYERRLPGLLAQKICARVFYEAANQRPPSRLSVNGEQEPHKMKGGRSPAKLLSNGLRCRK